MKRNFNLLMISLLLVSLSGPVSAQQQEPARAQPDQVEGLRQKLEEQEAILKRLEEALKGQADLIQQQRTEVEEMRQKMTQVAPAPSVTVAKIDPQTKPLVESGFGSIKVNGLIQGWFTSGNGGLRDTFRIRRTELKFTGQVSPKVKWTLMVDPSKALAINNTFTTVDGRQVVSGSSINQGSRILQDAFITYAYNKRVNVNVGQFKIPLGMEGLQSSAALDVVERTLFASDRARGGNFSDVRDLGVMVYGPLSKTVDYQVGFFNSSGETQNDVDKNDQKAVAGRLVTRPAFAKGLQIGGSGAWSGNGSRGDRPRRDRLGAEMLYVHDRFSFKSELMAGSDGDIHRRGYYTHFGYKVTPKLQAVVRYDTWDPNTRLEGSAADVTERDFITGFNYQILENNVKFQANYVRKTFTDGITASRNVFTLNLQTSW